MQDERERIQAGADADGVLSAAVTRKEALKFGDFLAKDKMAAISDARPGRIQLRRCFNA